MNSSVNKEKLHSLIDKMQNLSGNFLIYQESVFKKPEMPKEETAVTIKKTETQPSFVFVYSQKHSNDKITTYIANLDSKGLLLESVPGTLDKNLVFVKIRGTQNVLVHFAKVYNIDLAFQTQRFMLHQKVRFKFMATEVTEPSPDSSIYNRAIQILSEERPADITNTEKIMIINEILKSTSYGRKRNQFGIMSLVRDGSLLGTYPLHDGPTEWTVDGTLNHRQLLLKYWANMGLWYKQQPLILIEKYYGPEVAFYFAWLGFYTKMLIPSAILGVFFFVVGIITSQTQEINVTKEVCQSSLILCPRCIGCQYIPLKSSCIYRKLSKLFDNPGTVTFAVFMSIWATIFMELWKREQAVLQLKWNVTAMEVDKTLRPEYMTNTQYRRISSATGNLEPYTPLNIACFHYTVTYVTIIFMVLIVFYTIVGITIYRLAVTYTLQNSSSFEILQTNGPLIASITGSGLSYICILVFSLCYKRVSIWLTALENPRTQAEYDNSCIYKLYILEFSNNYGVMFYLAFIKGQFYSYPGDKSQRNFYGIKTDLCDPAGCLVDLCIQMFTIMFCNCVLNNIIELAQPIFLTWFNNKIRNNKQIHNEKLPQWEEDYTLTDVTDFYLTNEYMEMAILYGFITFFVAAFPLGPLFAFLNNIVEIRIDAFKLVKTCRRPVPNRVAGIGAWNGILQAITYIGIATNAFTIAITSNFIPRELYKYRTNYDLVGFVNSTLSEFDTTGFNFQTTSGENVATCYYQGKRYPPDHPQKYELTLEYWFEVAIRFIFVIIFEHVIITLTGVLAYAIPDTPYSVREHLNYQQTQYNELRMKVLNDEFMDKQRK